MHYTTLHYYYYKSQLICTASLIKMILITFQCSELQYVAYTYVFPESYVKNVIAIRTNIC